MRNARTTKPMPRARLRTAATAGVGMLAISLAVATGCHKSSGSSSTAPAGAISTQNVAHFVQNRSVTKDLLVQAAYNTADGLFFWKLSWAGNQGNTHDFYHYDAATGTWIKDGGDQRAIKSPTQTHSYESRLTIMVNDPAGGTAVPNFGLYGCFLVCHDNNRHMPQYTADGRTDEPTMGLPSSDPFYAGGMLDMWHWRAHRSNPTGSSDDQYVNADPIAPPGGDGGGRHGDAIVASKPYTTNGLTSGHPDFVQDPATTSTATYAFPFSQLFTTPDFFMTRDGSANPQEMAWATAQAAGYIPSDGDTVPRRRLAIPDGSRGDIRATIGTQVSAYDQAAGRWNVFLQRAMVTGATGNVDDVKLVDGQGYQIAFGLFSDGTGNRDHYVSLPLVLGLGTSTADIAAVKLTTPGQLPDFSDTGMFPVTIVECFLPGVASYEYLTGTQTTPYKIGDMHGGHDEVEKSVGGLATVGCANCHTVKASDPRASVVEGGPLETRVMRRGGVIDPTPISFSKTILAVLQSRCFSCHNDNGTASKFSMGNTVVDPDTAYLTIRGVNSTFIDYSDATMSPMLTIPSGNTDGNHPTANPVLAGFAGSQDYNRILYWLLFNAPNN